LLKNKQIVNQQKNESEVSDMKSQIAKHTMYWGITVVFFLILVPGFLQAGTKTVKGIVFEDANGSGIFDKGEKGIAGVVVSNQAEVVQTGADGGFRLPVAKETIIFVSKPAGYSYLPDENNLPRFYYIHYPAGSPAGLKYPGPAPTGKLPGSLYFPLIKTEEEETFDVIVVADPQVTNVEELALYRDDVVVRMMGTSARFYLALGDIMYNDLNLFDNMNRLVGQLGIPLYHVMGNHDMNFRVPDNHYEAETFKRIYGPDYYSFNYGKVHFVVLNSIKYHGWNREENKAGDYSGYIHERQLIWLKNDLSFVPDDRLVVLAMHIPIYCELYAEDSAVNIMNRKELFKILEERRHLLALAGHMHYFEYGEYREKSGWTGSAGFPAVIAGSGCGTWWHGPKDPRGIPYGISTDGSPNGYFCFTFSGNRFSYRFCPSAPTNSSQMRINSPSGLLDPREGKDTSINVNVFAGTPGTTVTSQLDNSPPVPMARKIMKDPFFTKMLEENRASYKDWIEPSLCTHIWEAPLPGDLKPGIHRLEITVKDQQGNVFHAYRLFEVAQ
jgi:3',5'-cyclic AMP phosphodiesterase CpdA